MEDFIPSGDVTGMYSCGPTVYAYQHLGNMRAYVFADTVRRLAPPLAGTGQRNECGSWMSRLREMERRMSSLILPSR